jgi:hypothetical protein
MNNRRVLKTLTLPLGVIASAVALAQAPPTPPVPQDQSGTPRYDPAQLPSFSGKVQQFTLTPRGEIDGLILTDGTEVKTPPHLSTAIAFAIKPGRGRSATSGYLHLRSHYQSERRRSRPRAWSGRSRVLHQSLGHDRGPGFDSHGSSRHTRRDQRSTPHGWDGTPITSRCGRQSFRASTTGPDCR